MPRKTSINKKQESPLDERMLRMIQNAQILSRSMLGSRLGVQFGGARDLYETFGYTRSPDFQTYQNLYDRHGLGQRVIRKFSDSTWNRLPVLIDGEQRSDTLDKSATPFLKEWMALAKRLGLAQVMRQADIMCQIGRYSILFLGAAGDDYSVPAKKGDQLFYIAAYNENQSQIQKLISDPKNEKFGMPENYTVQFNEIDIGVPMPGGTNVHHTRAIHISEDRLGSRIYGTPRLQAPLNRLFDLEKVTGGGAEAAWLAVWGGMLFSTQEDIDLPTEDSEEGKFLAEQMQKYFHRMQRYAVTKGLDVNNQGVSEVRIKDIYDTLKEDFAGTVGIPQRILFGSERGELASTQDREEWNSVIEARRTNFAEPELLFPFIDWCIANNVLPAPANKEYQAEWYPVYTMTKLEKAQYANALATGANSISGGVPEVALDVNEWRKAADLPIREEVAEEAGQEEEFVKEEEYRKLFQPKEKEEKEEQQISRNEMKIILNQQTEQYRQETQRDLYRTLLPIQNALNIIQNALNIRQQEQLQQNEEQRSLFQRLTDFILQRKPDQVNVHVENYPGEPPNVSVHNQIQPAPVENQIIVPPSTNVINVPPGRTQVINQVQPTPIKNFISTPRPKVDVKVENKNEVKLPTVTETAVVERDKEGRADVITKTYKQDEE